MKAKPEMSTFFLYFACPSNVGDQNARWQEALTDYVYLFPSYFLSTRHGPHCAAEEGQ